jgi:hypothetical protein
MSRQYSQNCLAMTRHDVSDCPATAIVVHGFSKRRSLSTHRLRFCEVLNPERTTFDNGSFAENVALFANILSNLLRLRSRNSVASFNDSNESTDKVQYAL